MTPLTILVAKRVDWIVAQFADESHRLDLFSCERRLFMLNRLGLLRLKVNRFFFNCHGKRLLFCSLFAMRVPLVIAIRTNDEWSFAFLDAFQLALQCQNQLLSPLHVFVQSFDLATQRRHQCILIDTFILRLLAWWFLDYTHISIRLTLWFGIASFWFEKLRLWVVLHRHECCC